MLYFHEENPCQPEGSSKRWSPWPLEHGQCSKGSRSGAALSCPHIATQSPQSHRNGLERRQARPIHLGEQAAHHLLQWHGEDKISGLQEILLALRVIFPTW